MYFRNTKVYFQSTKVYTRSTKVYSPSTKVYFQSTSILSNYTSIFSKNKNLLWKYKSILWRKNPKTRLLRVLFDSIDLLALFGVYAGIIPIRSSVYRYIANQLIPKLHSKKFRSSPLISSSLLHSNWATKKNLALLSMSHPGCLAGILTFNG